MPTIMYIIIILYLIFRRGRHYNHQISTYKISFENIFTYRNTIIIVDCARG